jgi:hypothetical protein
MKIQTGTTLLTISLLVAACSAADSPSVSPAAGSGGATQDGGGAGADSSVGGSGASGASGSEGGDAAPARWFTDDSVFNQPLPPEDSAAHPGYEKGTCSNDSTLACTMDADCGGPESDGHASVRTNFCQGGRTANFFKEAEAGVGTKNGAIYTMYASFGTPIHQGPSSAATVETVTCQKYCAGAFNRLPGTSPSGRCSTGGATCTKDGDCSAGGQCWYTAKVPFPASARVVQPDGVWAAAEYGGVCASDHKKFCYVGNERTMCPGSFCSYDPTLAGWRDDHMSVWFPDTGELFQFYHVSWSKDDNSFFTSAGGMIRTTGDGFESPLPPGPVYNHGAAFGHGVSALAIKPWELDAGSIDHALEMTVGWSPCASDWVAPAVSGSFNQQSCSDTLGSPIGTHVQLDPKLDCGALPNVKPDGATICRALQRYGAYISDWSLYPAVVVQMSTDASAFHTVAQIDGRDAVESTGIFKRSGWKPLGSSCSPGACLTYIPLSRLRVVKLPPRDKWCAGSNGSRCWQP